MPVWCGQQLFVSRSRFSGEVAPNHLPGKKQRQQFLPEKRHNPQNWQFMILFIGSAHTPLVLCGISLRIPEFSPFFFGALCLPDFALIYPDGHSSHASLHTMPSVWLIKNGETWTEQFRELELHNLERIHWKWAETQASGCKLYYPEFTYAVSPLTWSNLVTRIFHKFPLIRLQWLVIVIFIC